MGKKPPPEMVKLDVNLNVTVEVPIGEWDLTRAEGEEDPMATEDHLTWNLDLSYSFGDAWITSVDKVTVIEYG